MFTRIIFICTFILFIPVRSRAQDQSMSGRPEYPIFEEMPLFVGGLDNINTYRIPSVICTAGGTVLAFAEGRLNNNYRQFHRTDLRNW